MTPREMFDILLLVLALLGIAYFAGGADAAPVARGGNDKIEVTLFNDKCRLTSVVDLPYRAVWKEGGKSFEGCFGPTQFNGLIVLYFDDRSIALMPMQAFKPVREI